MKGYLFDGNVPSRLRFSPKLPITPLFSVGKNPTDSQIWDFARKHDWGIVSKDTNFSDRIVASSPPLRVVHLRFGNLRRMEQHTLLARRWPPIESLLKTNKLVNVYTDRLEGIGRNHCKAPANPNPCLLDQGCWQGPLNCSRRHEKAR